MTITSIEELHEFIKTNKKSVVISTLLEQSLLDNDLFFDYVLKYHSKFLYEISDRLSDKQKAKCVLNDCFFIQKCMNPNKELIECCLISYLHSDNKELAANLLAVIDYQIFNEEQLIKIISKDFTSIRYIQSPSVKLAKIAIQLYPQNIFYINKIDQDLIKYSIDCSSGNILYDLLNSYKLGDLTDEEKFQLMDYTAQNYIESFASNYSRFNQKWHKSLYVEKIDHFLSKNSDCFATLKLYSNLKNWDEDLQKFFYKFLLRDPHEKLFSSGLFFLELFKNWNLPHNNIDPVLLKFTHDKLVSFSQLQSTIRKNKRWNQFAHQIIKMIEN